jgi:hypothetical protein|nr:MAG TPA: peptidase [Bacteriophage sp.]
MKRKANVLGTEYTISFSKPYLDENLKGLDGYVDYSSKKIVIRNPGEIDQIDDKVSHMKVTARHELIHAFLYESGLSSSSLPCEFGWADNEEMVDWLAIQLPKVFDTFIEAEVL